MCDKYIRTYLWSLLYIRTSICCLSSFSFAIFISKFSSVVLVVPSWLAELSKPCELEAVISFSADCVAVWDALSSHTHQRLTYNMVKNIRRGRNVIYVGYNRLYMNKGKDPQESKISVALINRWFCNEKIEYTFVKYLHSPCKGLSQNLHSVR